MATTNLSGDPFRHIFGREHVNQPAAEVAGLLQGLDLGSLSRDQLDSLDRALSAGLSALRPEQMSRHGVSVREWKGKNGDPGYLRGPTHYANYGNFDGAWVDHPSLRVFEDGRKVYVSEPYRLEREGLLRLAELIQNGWQVMVDPGFSTHFPGSTMYVGVERRERST
jgi:hypothetical protein